MVYVTEEGDLREIGLDRKPVCCNVLMEEVEGYDGLNINGTTRQWVCKHCGHFITLTEGDLDEEELENWNENYGF